MKKLAGRLKNLELSKNIRIMEVCGTHTMEFFKTGVRDLLPEKLTLIDGPGCPVCVTPESYLNRTIAIARKYDAIIATFGDMVKVPSSMGTLRQAASEGLDLRVVYSPLDCLTIARENPGREVVFLSVGFETTAPAEAATLIEALEKGMKNFSVLAGNKRTPPAVEALLSMGETPIDGFIFPGHVSAVTGADAWKAIPGKYKKPSVISGFEAGDLITGVLSLVDLIENEQYILKNEYPVVVRNEGNKTALAVIDRVFKPGDAEWRGIGIIPESGLVLREEFAGYDAVQKFPVEVPESSTHSGCRCGELLRGLITPSQCPMFGKACRPEHAVGPCMVSSEGPCAAYYSYGREK